MERKSVVVFSVLVLLLAAQEVVVKTKALREAQAEELREALTEEQMEGQTEVGLCWRPCRRCPPGICLGPIGNILCPVFCRREGAIVGRCRSRRCFCLFRRCPAISDVLEE